MNTAYFQIGYLAAVPYVVIFVVIFPVSWAAQELVNRVEIQ